MTVQSILFDKHFWNQDLAESYLQLHNFKPIKDVHETLNYYRYRLAQPKKNGRYFTKKLHNGVSLIINI